MKSIPSHFLSTRRPLWIAFGLAAALLLNAHTTSAQVSAARPVSGSTGGASIKEHARSISALADQSELIAVGKVGRLVSEWNEDKSRIRTRVTISVDEAIKGSAPGSSVTVVVPGGEVDGVGEWYSHSVQFQKEEDVVVFANRDNNGQFVVTDGEFGKFSVKKDKDTGAKIIPNVGTLDTFTAQIKHSVKMQDTNKKEQ
jgi:hypothetical protein